MALLELSGIGRVFGEGDAKTVALRDASFSIDAGEFVAIMGPSGSGKSTLLHIMGLLDRQTEGVYQLEGQDTRDLGDERLAHLRNEKIGFVFQFFHLLARTSVLDNVLLPLSYSRRPQREYKQRALKAIEQVGLSHRLGHMPGMLSGGERQRVAMARALVNEPSIIFADEPTGNLDTKTGEQIMALVEALHQQGHTVLLITHEQAASQYAQRIMRMKDGQIV